MSSSDQTKVFIDLKHLVAYRITDEGGKKTKEITYEGKLEKNNLPKTLLDLKEKYQIDRVGLLFADDLVLTDIIQDESNTGNDRETVSRLVKDKMSIDFDKTVWDYTKIGNRYQIVCLPDDYTGYIAPAFDQAGIKIESIEPISVSLAKLMSNQSEPTMLVYDGVERLVMVCWQGLVFEPTLFIPVELSNKAKKIKQNFHKQFNNEINQAVVSASFADSYVADLTALSLNTEVNPLDPFTGIEVVRVPTNQKQEEITDVAKTAVDAESEKPENFKDVWQENPKEEKKTEKPVETEKVEVVKEKETVVDIQVNRDESIKPKRNLTWLAIVIPLLITFIAVGYLLINNKNKEEMFNPLIESSVSADTASSSAILTDKTKLKIQVLNGSGKAGEAAKVKSLLETTGFTVEAVGNATTSSAIKTEIKSKIALSDTLKKDFQDSLTKLYDTQFTVGTVAGFDVVVTVGKSK